MRSIALFTILLFFLSACSSSKKSVKTKPSVKIADPLSVTESDFQEKILDNEKVSVVYFWATWCGPCDITGPVIDELSKQQVRHANFGKVNVDECPQITSRYDILHLPTVLIIKNGEVVDQNIGGFSSSLIRALIKKHSQAQVLL